MREIKFRAWDKVQKTMVYRKSFDSSGGLVMTFDGEVYSAGKFMNEHIELMQYTGLKDKNGKEIYEGDIVKVDFHYCIDTQTLEHNDTVIFEEGSFELKEQFGDGLSMLALNNRCEVIGNIYENKELLK